MAKSAVPNPLKRRHLIEEDLSEAKCLALADAYLEEGRANEAVAFLVKAGAEDRLDEMIREAIAAGDAFLVKQLADETGKDPGRDRWQATAEAAEQAGRVRYAEMARRHARSSED